MTRLAATWRAACVGAALSCAGGGPGADPPLAVQPAPPVRRSVVVARGDTLWRIARDQGVSVETLARINGVADPRRLAVGRVLEIPSGAETVEAGEAPGPPVEQRPAPPVRTPRPTPPPARKPAPAPAPPPPTAASPPLRTATLRSEEVASRPPPAPPPAPEPAFLAADLLLAQAEAQLDGARFEEALEASDRARAALEPVAGAAGAGERLVQGDVLAATALLALGREAGARERLARALALEPGLELDPATTSPRVLDLLALLRPRGE